AAICTIGPASIRILPQLRGDHLDCGRGECPIVDLIGSHRPSGETSQFGTAMAVATADSDPVAAMAAMVEEWSGSSFFSLKNLLDSPPILLQHPLS
ncbi:hypothetical protein ACJX0J_042087, partial [Zea mays]